ncbi:MAG: serine esterase [Bdellovibrionaceae bacterium]|nr:serine esterase [Pseudobdellovibrionaceae bacterium]
MPRKLRRLGQIDCIELYAGEAHPWIILFHGYGADADDLAPLAQIIRTQRPFNWLFPQGIEDVPIGPAWMGKAWWKLDISRIENFMRTGTEWDLSEEVPAGLSRARENVDLMLRELKVPGHRLVLGGFSQGGMLAVDTALRLPENPMGLLLLSTACINKKEWSKLAPKRAGTPYFLSHGREDQVLSFKNGQRLQSLLNEAGLKGPMLEFSGGHEIPPNVIAEASRFLDSINTP